MQCHDNIEGKANNPSCNPFTILILSLNATWLTYRTAFCSLLMGNLRHVDIKILRGCGTPWQIKLASAPRTASSNQCGQGGTDDWFTRKYSSFIPTSNPTNSNNIPAKNYYDLCPLMNPFFCFPCRARFVFTRTDSSFCITSSIANSDHGMHVCV